MNIGETDADGWTYVLFGDAAKAAQEGAHEVEARPGDTFDWAPIGTTPYWQNWQYRIREKARTITVTIPRPLWCEAVKVRLDMPFSTPELASAAQDAIRDAMGQS